MMGGFKAMTLEQIAEFKKMFVNAVLVCKKAGFDAVEVMAGVGGVMSRFMSQATRTTAPTSTAEAWRTAPA